MTLGRASVVLFIQVRLTCFFCHLLPCNDFSILVLSLYSWPTPCFSSFKSSVATPTPVALFLKFFLWFGAASVGPDHVFIAILVKQKSK